MKKLPKKQFLPMDEEEVELAEFLDGGDYEVKELNAKEKEKYKKAALETMTAKKQISINLLERDLKIIKSKAMETGIPYQTMIGALVHNYAVGKIKLEV
ncbi:MAG TPA: hypothetical protein PKW30_05360 [Campylobacterales bacterium]|nr:hypothetical protein [Campylobacterales bacterium]